MGNIEEAGVKIRGSGGGVGSLLRFFGFAAAAFPFAAVLDEVVTEDVVGAAVVPFTPGSASSMPSPPAGF